VCVRIYGRAGVSSICKLFAVPRTEPSHHGDQELKADSEPTDSGSNVPVRSERSLPVAYHVAVPRGPSGPGPEGGSGPCGWRWRGHRPRRVPPEDARAISGTALQGRSYITKPQPPAGKRQGVAVCTHSIPRCLRRCLARVLSLSTCLVNVYCQRLRKGARRVILTARPLV
jgi:hypothetical protein